MLMQFYRKNVSKWILAREEPILFFFQTIYHIFTPYCKVNFFKGICKNKNNIVSISKICCQLRHLVILFKNRIKG